MDYKFYIYDETLNDNDMEMMMELGIPMESNPHIQVLTFNVDEGEED